MFKHILVPLDGSALAESVLPAAAYMSGVFNARVTLVHVIEINAPEKIHGQPHLRDAEEAKSYLEKISREMFPDNADIECHVHTSAVKDVTGSIVQHVDELGSDLIIMCSHGYGGLRDILFGSIAQQVISLGSTPVLIIRPESEGSKAEMKCHRIMVPLDGNPEHERSMNAAAEIAPACKASVHLILVVQTLASLSGRWKVTGRMLPATTSRMLDMYVNEAEEYLREQQTKMQKRGIEVTYNVFRGEPAEIIRKAAAELGIDMIIIGTHGKAGTDAFWSGSVTARVCKSCSLPLMLIPVDGKTS